MHDHLADRPDGVRQELRIIVAARLDLEHGLARHDPGEGKDCGGLAVGIARRVGRRSLG